MEVGYQLWSAVPVAAEAPTVERGFQASDLLGVLAVFLLVAMNGFFVAGEFALVSVRRTRMAQLAEEGNGGAKSVDKALHHLDDYIAATQLGITLASLALGWVGEPALEHLIQPPLSFLLGGLGGSISSGVAVAITFILITSLHIVVGELAPKSIALQRSEGTSLFIIRPLDLFLNIFRPFIWLLNGAGRLAVRLIGLNDVDEHSKVHSAEELEMLVTQSGQAGVLDDQETTLLHKVFEFDDKTARQIMMPRTEIVGVPENANLDELLDKASDERYTRFPVYRDTLDQIIGVIHVKDLFPLLRERGRHYSAAIYDQNNGTTSLPPPKVQLREKSPLAAIIRPVMNVPESIHVADLLTQMRQRQAHLAVVIDEYGGTSGIVTLEDALEELVGEVQDEFDTSEEDNNVEIEMQPDGTALVSGLMPLQAIEDRFGLAIPEEQYEMFDTVGGFVMGELGRVPTVGDEVSMNKYRFTVEKMDGLRIDRLSVKKD